MFIDSQFTLDYESQMTDKYFAEYTRIKVKQFREALLQHMSNVKSSLLKEHVTKDCMTEGSGTGSGKIDTSSMSGNDADTDNADIKPVYDKEPMTESTENADLKAQLQEKVFAIAALKNELRNLKGNSVDTKFAKPSVLGKQILQPLRN
ncbi:hypothetical protein Tco_0676957 [Tanacetum coccineum]